VANWRGRHSAAWYSVPAALYGVTVETHGLLAGRACLQHYLAYMLTVMGMISVRSHLTGRGILIHSSVCGQHRDGGGGALRRNMPSWRAGGDVCAGSLLALGGNVTAVGVVLYQTAFRAC